MNGTVLLSISIPVVALLAGGAIATVRAPSANLRSIIRHFTAGVIFAAAGAEVLPDLLHTRGTASAIRVVIGVALGVVVMIAIRELAERIKRQG
ncbi:MAG: transporter, partial [Ktedonobacterales bacterium]|nr:transporter [Ktedonobacterales bacterium]